MLLAERMLNPRSRKPFDLSTARCGGAVPEHYISYAHCHKIRSKEMRSDGWGRASSQKAVEKRNGRECYGGLLKLLG